MQIHRWGVITALVAVMVVGCAGDDTECGEFPLDDDQRTCVVQTIDDMVHDVYPFADYKGVDLDEFSRELWATLEGDDRDDQEFLSDVNHVLSMLKDGHTRMERRVVHNQQAVAPLDVRRVGEEVVVDSVYGGEHSELIGQTVTRIDGQDAGKLLDQFDGRIAPVDGAEAMLSDSRLALAGEAGSSVELTLEGGETVELSRQMLDTTPQVQRFDDDIGYLRVETFGYIDDLERLDAALAEVMDTRALMLDLRGNGGGYPSVAEGLFARLVDEQQGSFRLVDNNGQLHRELPMEPRGDTYDGEVVLLVDSSTYSASNLFAHRMHHHNRGVLVGEKTGGGAASPATTAKLVPGVWFQVSTHVVRDPDGQHRESGIEPGIPVDVEAHLELRENAEGQVAQPLDGPTGDPVIDRAIRYLEELE